MFSTSHLHPMLVHFPIALVSIGFLAELVALFLKREAWLVKAGFYLLLVGAVAALSAWLTGNLFTSDMSGSAEEVRELHEVFATITLITVWVCALFRIFLNVTKREETSLKWVAFSLYGLAALFVSITGFYGGTLVYNYMMPL